MILKEDLLTISKNTKYFLFLGISRDSWHKRRATGGKKKPITKKRKHCLGRPPANTKVSLKESEYMSVN